MMLTWHQVFNQNHSQPRSHHSSTSRHKETGLADDYPFIWLLGIQPRLNFLLYATPTRKENKKKLCRELLLLLVMSMIKASYLFLQRDLFQFPVTTFFLVTASLAAITPLFWLSRYLDSIMPLDMWASEMRAS
jgi:hypothetical protein